MQPKALTSKNMYVLLKFLNKRYTLTIMCHVCSTRSDNERGSGGYGIYKHRCAVTIQNQ